MVLSCHPYEWLRRELVPPAPYLVCKPAGSSNGSGIFVQLALSDAHLDVRDSGGHLDETQLALAGTSSNRVKKPHSMPFGWSPLHRVPRNAWKGVLQIFASCGCEGSAISVNALSAFRSAVARAVWSKKLSMTTTPALLSLLDGPWGSDPAFYFIWTGLSTIVTLPCLQAGGRSYFPTSRLRFYVVPWAWAHPSSYWLGIGLNFLVTLCMKGGSWLAFLLCAWCLGQYNTFAVPSFRLVKMNYHWSLRKEKVSGWVLLRYVWLPSNAWLFSSEGVRQNAYAGHIIWRGLE